MGSEYSRLSMFMDGRKKGSRTILKLATSPKFTVTVADFSENHTQSLIVDSGLSASKENFLS